MTRIGPVVLVRRIALTLVVVGLVALAAIDPFTLLNVITYAGIGAFLVDRRPRNPIGWLLLALGVLWLGTSARPDRDVAALVAGTAAWNDFLWVWFGAWAGSLSFVCYAALAFLFPSGSLPVGRWGTVARVALPLSAVLSLLPAISPSIELSVADNTATLWAPNLLSPLGADGSFRPLLLGQAVSTLIPISTIALGAANLLRRYGRGSAIEHLQIRWLLASIAFMVLAILYGLSVWVIGGPEFGWVAWLPALFAYPTVPVSIAVAVLRYRLYEIDRIVSRTLSWAIVTSVLVAIFAALVVGLQAVLADATQGETLAVAASTLIAFALFQPVRRRVQRAVDHRFDRARYDGERMAAAFAERLRAEVDLEAVAGELTRSIDGALRPSSVVLWLKDGAE